MGFSAPFSFRASAGFLLLLAPLAGRAQGTLSPDIQAKLTAAVNQALAKTGAPSAEIGIVRNGQVVFSGAFGLARLEPKVEASPEMPYRIGSVSKQFTAAAVLVLVEQGKLRLDDPVSTWFPELGHSHEVTVRMLLNQVSGYSDDYTEDYLTPEMARPGDLYQIIREWAAKPLDFTPGTKWQYSNTNYGLAALIVQKVAGEPFFGFLKKNVLEPAGITHALDLDTADIPPVPVGYAENAFGPMRAAQQEGKGTLAGAGELAMPVAELAKWNTVVLKRQVLSATSWETMEAEAALPDGRGTGYGMGLHLGTREAGAHGGRRVLDHTGEVNGFGTVNTLYPAEGMAVSVLTNGEVSTAPVLAAVEGVMFSPDAMKDPGAPAPALTADRKVEQLTMTALAQLAQGRMDRALLAPNLDFYFTPQTLGDYRDSLSRLGTVTTLEPVRTFDRGGMHGWIFRAKTHGGQAGAEGSFVVFVYVTADGKLDQLMLERE